jgi:hypothetical protein
MLQPSRSEQMVRENMMIKHRFSFVPLHDQAMVGLYHSHHNATITPHLHTLNIWLVQSSGLMCVVSSVSWTWIDILISHH